MENQPSAKAGKQPVIEPSEPKTLSKELYKQARVCIYINCLHFFFCLSFYERFIIFFLINYVHIYNLQAAAAAAEMQSLLFQMKLERV